MDEVGTFAIWPDETSFNTAHLLQTPSGITIGDPMVATDGRRACADNWTEEDAVWFAAHGATMSFELPADWWN